MSEDPSISTTGISTTGMPARAGAALADVRAEIDLVDAALHDLLMQRTDLVASVAAAKAAAASQAGQGSFIALRPGREAQVLRALAARHKGPLPLDVVFRVWREIISAKIQLQGPFRVEVAGGDAPLGLWDLARSFYGSSTEMALHDHTRQVLQQVADDRSTLGVLPLPTLDEVDPWWPGLVGQGPQGVKVVARLPFLVRHETDDAPEPLGAFAVAQAEYEESGDDISLVVLRTNGPVSESASVALLDRLGFDGVERFSVAPATGSEAAQYSLMAVGAYVTPDDPRLGGLEDGAGELALIGGYARPVDVSGALWQMFMPGFDAPSGGV